MIAVDDGMFVIGLVELFRQAMKDYEAATLLPLAETVGKALALTPSAGPVEGYYGESAPLERYFRLIRAMQQAEMPAVVPESARGALARLRAFFEAPAIGRVEAGDRVLPRATSPFGEALRTLANWSVDGLSHQARQLVGADDASLLAVAAATGDPVALCVARETVVLSAEVELAEEDEPVPGFVWAVTEPVAAVAGRFVAALAKSTGIRLPEPVAAAADLFGQAAGAADIDGRCIMVGERFGNPYPFYHWYAVRRDGCDMVRDFWSSVIWTTGDLRRLPVAEWPQAGAKVGAPASEPSTPARMPSKGWLSRLLGGGG